MSKGLLQSKKEVTGRRILLKLAADYAEELHSWNKGEGFLTCIAKFESVRALCCDIYQLGVFEGWCIPVEHLTEAEKLELWQFVKLYCDPFQLNQKEKIKAAKAYHGLGSYLENRSKITT